MKELLELGPRETGSPSHAKFIDEIAREIESLSLPVHRDSHKFSRWSLQISVQIVSLKLPDRNLLVASAYPYSGVTGPKGVKESIAFLKAHQIDDLFEQTAG